MAALPVIATVAGLAGGAVSAYGQYESGQATSAAASYQAQVAANNAAIARQNAELSMQAGEQQAGISEMRTRANVGTTKAGQAASGVDVNSASSTNVRAGEAEIGQLDALTIRSNAAKQAYGYEVAATSDTAQSQLESMEASNAKTAGTLGALGTAIGSIGSVGMKYAGLQNVQPQNSANQAVDLTYSDYGYNNT